MKLHLLFTAALVAAGPAASFPDYYPPERTANDAYKDWRAGKPLPGMPDLALPVRVKAGATLCETDGLLTPQAAGAMQVAKLAGSCADTPRAIPVRILPPRDAQSYMQAYVSGTVRVAISSPEQSDASVTLAWARIVDLESGRVPAPFKRSKP